MTRVQAGANRTLQLTLILLLVFLVLASLAVLAALWIFASLPDGMLGAIGGEATPVQAAVFATRANRLAVAFATFSTAACEAAVIVLLLRMLASARRGAPFIAANVLRLRWIAAAFALALACRFVLPALASPEVAGWMRTSGWSYNLGDLGPALVALVLAQVFGEGIRLREDVEATI